VRRFSEVCPVASVAHSAFLTVSQSDLMHTFKAVPSRVISTPRLLTILSDGAAIVAPLWSILNDALQAARHTSICVQPTQTELVRSYVQTELTVTR
jgi:hypothetical protein